MIITDSGVILFSSSYRSHSQLVVEGGGMPTLDSQGAISLHRRGRDLGFTGIVSRNSDVKGASGGREIMTFERDRHFFKKARKKLGPGAEGGGMPSCII